MPCLASGQKLSIGLAAGWSLTDNYRGAGRSSVLVNTPSFSTTVTTVTTTSPHNLIIGPKLEVTLGGAFSLEADALYRRRQWAAFSSFSPPVDFGYGLLRSAEFRVAGSSWEVPILLKCHLPAAAFLEVGPSLRPWLYRGGAARAGITVGAGWRKHLRNLSIEPAVRYTRWGAEQQFYRAVSSNNDQVEFLVGVGGRSLSLRPTVLGQTLSFGILGGFDLTGDFPPHAAYESARSKLVGIQVETRLAKRLSIEVDGLYHPLILSEGQRATVLTWEFPVLAKYRFGGARATPFLELGPAFRATGNLSGTNPSHHGVSAGAGMETRIGWLSASSALRFTRWKADPVGDSLSAHTYALRNQVQLLVGFRF